MRRLRTIAPAAILLAAAGAAALAPVVSRSAASTAVSTAEAPFPGWPTHYEGRTLVALPLTPRETAFLRDFPGRVGRFSDGEREIIIRFVGAPSRRLHAAADCFRGSGYSVTPLPARRDASGATMGCFRATLNGASMIVCEVIRDDRGDSWSDVSAWYWDGMLRASPPPWWSFVVAETEAPEGKPRKKIAEPDPHFP
jgi:hypothetical protein